MNAVTVSVEGNRPGLMGHDRGIRRFPLAARIVELLLAIALYAAALAGVDYLTGKSILPVAVTAMFLMPAVLSIALRLARTVDRRYGVRRHLGLAA